MRSSLPVATAKNRSVLLLLLLAPLVATTAGCAGAAIGVGTATSVNTVADRRSAGTMLDDETIEYNVLSSIGDEPDLHEVVHVNAVSINGKVLLTGEAPTEAARARIEGKARAVRGVQTVYNEVEVGPETSIASRANDSLITGKVKTALLTRSFEEGTRIKVVTERGTVYLMGLMTRAEADAATEVTRNVAGVRRVVRVFEFTD